jgi:hypothetical protein
MSIPKIQLAKLKSTFAQLERQGVQYGLGAKAEGYTIEGKHWNPRSNGHLNTPVNTLDNIDCSGFVRYILFHATDEALVIPDGSQVQREWFEKAAARGETHKLTNYADANTYISDSRLFIGFIKPNTNGCGPVGHVWLIGQFDEDVAAETLESYGGHGVASRTWNALPLRTEVYSVYSLPTA